MWGQVFNFDITPCFMILNLMARPLRIEYDGAVYHVTARGNARLPIFRQERDFLSFLDILQQVSNKYNWICHTYCLMSNHYHLLIETPDGNLSTGMRQLNGVYTQAFNKKNRRVGHVFQGRYKAILIQKESHLLGVCRYVVLNPVRARVVERPEQWKWSSYRALIGKEKPHSCLHVGWVLGQFGKRKSVAKRRYIKFVSEGIGERSILKDVRGQSILGEDDFVDGLIEYVKGRREIQEIPKRQRYLHRPDLDGFFHTAAAGDKGSRNRLIMIAVKEHGYSHMEVARHLNMHYSTVSRILSREEKNQN